MKSKDVWTKAIFMHQGNQKVYSWQLKYERKICPAALMIEICSLHYGI